MNKFLKVGAAIALGLTLTACSSNGSDSDADSKKIVVGCLLYTSPSPRDRG